jgi:hypothetical protein
MGVVSKNSIGEPRTDPNAVLNNARDAWNPAYEKANDPTKEKRAIAIPNPLRRNQSPRDSEPLHPSE